MVGILVELFMSDDTIQLNAVELATELTIAWLANPNTRTSADEVPGFLAQMHSSVQSLMGSAEGANAPAADTEEYTPAVSARKSLANPDFIVSMIDGKQYKTLRRHLSGHGLTPEQYRERYNLKSDYPIVAPSYSESRRDMAKRIGLGRKPGQPNAAEAGAEKPAPRKRKTEEAAAE
jgi:predicted transcriptional regulator